MTHGTFKRLSFFFSLHVLFCLQVRAAIVEPSQAAAVFNLNTVTGWVRFYESDSQTTVLVNLQGLDAAVMDWSIRTIPVDETLRPSVRCSEDYLGRVYTPRGMDVGNLTGRLGIIESDGLALFNDTQRAITLQGADSVVGRSLRLQVGTEVICATIRSKIESALKDEVVTMKATFISPVAGTVYFRQNDNEPAAIFGKLFWVNENPVNNVNWSISDELLNEMYRAGSCGSMQPYVTDDLTERHGMITIGDSARPYSNNAFYFTDSSLKITGPTTIEGLSLFLFNGNDVIGCAPIAFSEVIEAFQYPDFTIQIRQASPYENSTLVQTGEFNAMLNHVVLNAAWMTNGLCPLTDEVYNPLSIDTDGSEEVFRTPDLFAYGDISGKYNPLLAPSQQLALTELPMYGEFSMLGLTARRVMDSGDNSYRMCDALVPLKDENTLLAKATFEEGSVRGAIYFLQRQDPQLSGQPGVTNIIVDLYYEDSATSETTGHVWEVQEGTCSSSASGAYNPFNVFQGSDYASQCTPTSSLRCEYGDLTGKHGQLTIGPLGASRTTKAVVDTNLQLDGEYRIVGQSIRLYPSGSSTQSLACAEIELVKANDPADTDVIVAFPETNDFERVAFTKELVEMSSLEAKVDPSDLLILHEEVGMLQSSQDSSIQCAVAQLKLTSSSVVQANMYAAALQNSICNELADNGCMKQLPEYVTLCASGARAMVSLSVTMVLIMAAILVSVIF